MLTATVPTALFLTLTLPAAAQVGQITSSVSWAEALVLNPSTVTTVNVTNYSTQIIGRLAGGAPLFDQTFAASFADPATQAGVGMARAAVTSAGGPGVIVGAPVLTARSTSVSSSNVTTYSLASSQTIVNPGVVTFGPAMLTVGQLSACNVGSLPSTTRPSCQNLPGVPFVLGPNDTNVNVRTDTTHTVNQATTTTNTTSLSEQYTISGSAVGSASVQAFGFVHTAVQSGALDAGSRFLRRLGDESGGPEAANALGSVRPGVVGAASSGLRVWTEGYGAWSRAKADRGAPGDERVQYGFASGISGAVMPNLVLGFGIDHGNTDLKLDRGFERGDIRLTQIGLYGGYTLGPWFLSLAGTFGMGEARTQHEVGGFTSGRYDVTTAGVLGEAGYRWHWGVWRVTPTIGFDHTVARTDRFAEIGPLALAAPAQTSNRTRTWAGLDIGQRIGVIDWSVYGRLVGVVAGQDRLLPVSYLGVPMRIEGVRDGRIGGDAGARAAYLVTPGMELFARYDGRFRENFTAHAATAGMRLAF